MVCSCGALNEVEIIEEPRRSQVLQSVESVLWSGLGRASGRFWRVSPQSSELDWWSRSSLRATGTAVV